MSKIKLRMTLDEIYEVDLSECDFSYMTEKEIKNYLISEFLKELDNSCVKAERVSNKPISPEWSLFSISKTIESYKVEFGRELTDQEIGIICNSYFSGTFDHDEKLMSIQK